MDDRELEKRAKEKRALDAVFAVWYMGCCGIFLLALGGLTAFVYAMIQVFK